MHYLFGFQNDQTKRKKNIFQQEGRKPLGKCRKQQPCSSTINFLNQHAMGSYFLHPPKDLNRHKYPSLASPASTQYQRHPPYTIVEPH